MKPASASPMKGACVGRVPPSVFGSGFLGLVHRTALLNLGIMLSALAVGVFTDSRENFLILFVLLPSVSLVLWSATFALSSFAALGQVFRRQGSGAAQEPAGHSCRRGGLGDDWVDGI